MFNRDFIIGLIVMIGIFCLYFYSMRGNEKEDFENGKSNIHFMSKEETEKKLLNERDPYYQSFSIYDLEARGVKSLDEYLQKIKPTISDFSNSQIKRIQKLSSSANQRIQNLNKKWLNGKVLKEMTWKFGLTNGNGYEGGLPHTRDDYIMLSDEVLKNDDKYLIGTLIHEKVHLYQRKYPDAVEKYKEENGIRRWKRKDVNDRIRANPDTDEYIYKTKNGEAMMSVYEKNPKGLEDVKTYPKEGQQNEHPHEKMAIEVEEMVT
jgi:hypothetical protein